MLLFATGIASTFLICDPAVHKISDGPIIGVAMKHLDISQCLRLGIVSIERASGLGSFTSVIMPTAQVTSFALWASLSTIVFFLR